MQSPHAFLDHGAAMDAPIGIERLELLAISPYSHAYLQSPVAEMVEGRDLLGGDDNAAPHRQHEDAGAESELRRMRGQKCIRDQGLPEARRNGKLLAHVMLRRHVVISPHVMIAERFGVLGYAQEALRIGKWDRVGQPFHSGRKSDAEQQTRGGHSDRSSRGNVVRRSTPPSCTTIMSSTIMPPQPTS